MSSPFTIPNALVPLRELPGKAIAPIAAILGFAAIGVVNTASFVLNKTADLIAWAANDRREESWAPFVLATVTLIFFIHLLLTKLLQNKSAKPIEYISKEPNTLPTQPFGSDSAFAAGLRRAGRNADLFALPSPPADRATTRAPSPVVDPADALLDAALAELKKNSLRT